MGPWLGVLAGVLDSGNWVRTLTKNTTSGKTVWRVTDAQLSPVPGESMSPDLPNPRGLSKSVIPAARFPLASFR
jgi:hypothetical protein